MTSRKVRPISRIIHQSTMLKWVSFGYLLSARDNGIEITQAAEDFCKSNMFLDEQGLSPQNIRKDYYLLLKQVLNERKLDSIEQGAPGNSGLHEAGE